MLKMLLNQKPMVRSLFTLGAIISFLSVSLAMHAGYDIKKYPRQPRWDKNLDLKKIEADLTNSEVVKLTPMRDHLSASGSESEFFGTHVFLAELDNGLKAVYKCNPEEVEDAYAEVIAYKASEYLGIHLVPPTVMKKSGNRFGSLQFYVEPSMDLLKDGNYKKALSLADPVDIANKDIFYFVFGQWDFGPHNMIVQENEGKHYIALIDNGVIKTHQKIQYGDFAFARVFYSEKLRSKEDDLPFSFKSKPVELNQTTLTQEFKGALTQARIDDFLRNKGVKFLNYAIWRNGLWIQWHKGDPEFQPLKPVIFPESTIKKVRSLTRKSLNSIYMYKAKMDNINDAYFADLLDRKNQMLKASVSHSEYKGK